MKTYLTQYERNGKQYAGPKIKAPSLIDAEWVCSVCYPGVTVVGELVEEIEVRCH